MNYVVKSLDDASIEASACAGKLYLRLRLHK